MKFGLQFGFVFAGPGEGFGARGGTLFGAAQLWVAGDDPECKACPASIAALTGGGGGARIGGAIEGGAAGGATDADSTSPAGAGRRALSENDARIWGSTTQ